MDGLCILYLVGYVFGISECEMINARGLVWLLAWLEGGGFQPFPSHKRKRCDVVGFWGGSLPIAM